MSDRQCAEQTDRDGGRDGMLLDGRRVSVVDTAELAAYCMPGRAPSIVLTAGALHRLSRREVDAVVAHEVAHLRGRHHLWVAWAGVLEDAFPFVPLLREARLQVSRLVEWAADDAACRGHGSPVVAHALAAMATGNLRGATTRVDDGVLTAAGSGVPERVERLVRPRTPRGRPAGGSPPPWRCRS